MTDLAIFVLVRGDALRADGGMDDLLIISPPQKAGSAIVGSPASTPKRAQAR
jgi:hypothetical protein